MSSEKDIKKIARSILKGTCNLSLEGQYDVLTNVLNIYEASEEYEQCAIIYKKLCESEMIAIRDNINKMFHTDQ